jgi:chromosome segregation ATPase
VSKKCSEVLKGRNELNIQVNNLSTTFKNLLSQQNNLKEQEKNIEIKSKEINELEQKIEFEREKFKNLRGKDLEKALNDLNEEVSRRIYELGNKEERQQIRTLKEGSSGEEYSHCRICKENCHDPCDCIHFFTSRCTIYPVFGSDCERCGHPKDDHSRDKYRYCFEYINVKSINEDEIKKTKLEKQRREQQIKESMNAENNKKTNIENMIETLQDQINDLEDQKLEIVKKKSEIEAKIKETNNQILFIIVRLQSISQRISDLAMNNNYIQKDNEYIDSLIDKYNEVYGNDNEKVKELEEMKRRNEQFQKACQLNKEEIFNLDDSQLADLLKNMNF